MTMPRRRLVTELLEARHLLTSGPSILQFVGSELAKTPQVVDTALETSAPTLGAPTPTSIVVPQAASSRWDWLAHTKWYVPTENMLAYTVGTNLDNPIPTADQTLWNIRQSSGGKISGDGSVTTSVNPTPTQLTFEGNVTEGGQIRINFVTSSGVMTTGIGQMRFLNGQWYAQMQMATQSPLIVTHWAYQAQLTGNVVPPDPASAVLDTDLLSTEWRWVKGTHWALGDTDLFGDGPATGVFSIDSYRNGYFWGSGTSATQPFNVMGSITPEGNVLLMVSVTGAYPSVRTGVIANGMMHLRTYEGTPAVGAAWLIGAPGVPSSRWFLSSVVAATTR